MPRVWTVVVSVAVDMVGSQEVGEPDTCDVLPKGK